MSVAVVGVLSCVGPKASSLEPPYIYEICDLQQHRSIPAVGLCWAALCCVKIFEVVPCAGHIYRCCTSIASASAPHVLPSPESSHCLLATCRSCGYQAPHRPLLGITWLVPLSEQCSHSERVENGLWVTLSCDLQGYNTGVINVLSNHISLWLVLT